MGRVRDTERTVLVPLRALFGRKGKQTPSRALPRHEHPGDREQYGRALMRPERVGGPHACSADERSSASAHAMTQGRAGAFSSLTLADALRCRTVHATLRLQLQKASSVVLLGKSRVGIQPCFPLASRTAAARDWQLTVAIASISAAVSSAMGTAPKLDMG